MAPKTIQSYVHAKQVDLLYRQLPFSLLASLAVAFLILIFVQDPHIASPLRIWFMFVVLVVAFRGFLFFYYNHTKKQDSFQVIQAERLFLIGVILAGTTMGSMGWWLYPMAGEISSKMAIFIVLLGLAAGSMTTLSYRPLPCYLFICLTLLPLFFGLYQTPVDQNYFLVVALVIYIFFLIKNVHVFQKNNEEMLFLREKARHEALYLESILQSSTNTAIVATDTNYCCRYFNPEAERIFGIKKDTVLGKNITEIHAGLRQDGMGRLQQLFIKIQQTGFHQFPLQIGKFTLDVQITGINDQHESLAGFLLMAKDITESEQTEDLLRKLSRAIEQSHSTIVITDLKGKIEFVNPAFTRTTGYNHDEILGKNFLHFQKDLHGDDLIKFIWATLSAGKVWQGDMRNKRKDGSIFWENVTISPIRNDSGKTSGYVAIKEDITRRKETEKQLIKTQQEAQAANRAKSVFLANMSHDIRTPMNGIIGMTRLILDTDLSSEQFRYLQHIKTSADGLLGLLNDILDFSKIEAGQLSIEKHDFNLLKMLDDTISTMTFAAREKGIELILEKDEQSLPVHVRGDELRLRQILINLIGNSVKFVEKGHILLKIFPENVDGTQTTLHFIVEDTGVGIPDHQLEQIFFSFNQADSSTTRKVGGTGLGLAISKQLVEMMGGKIWVESNVNEGATFHFTTVLDLGKNIQIPLSSKKKKIEADTEKLNILVVDDNKINCEIAKHVLAKDGHQSMVVGNGMEALERISAQNFDLILMDIQMPVMDGLTACTIIRNGEKGGDLQEFNLPSSLAEKLMQQLRGRHIPIVAMTAHALKNDQRKCMEAGMDKYLTKPFVPEQMKAIISELKKDD